MTTIKNHAVFKMSAENKPALTITSGTTVVFETMDCFNNQITCEEQEVDSLDWNYINPATGPLFIEGAKAGDTLQIKIEDIEVASVGTMAAIPENGVLGTLFEKGSIKKIKVKNNIAYFNEKIKLTCSPMIGVIGVAPKEGEVPCGEPGSHGGNMDNARIKKGATLYLPVFHEGALLSIGDVHACMGDGEVMVTGLEIPARVTVRVELLKNKPIANPQLEDEDFYYTIASHEDLEQAVYIAVNDMVKVVMEIGNLSFNDAGMLLSAACDLQFCQVVDPKRTVRMALPKKLFF